MYTHSPDPSKQYAILRKIRGSRDQAIPGYFAPQEQIPWVRGWVLATPTKSLFRRPKNEVKMTCTATHVKISQLVNKTCSQQACSKFVNIL
jgi:hypothetical protein